MELSSPQPKEARIRVVQLMGRRLNCLTRSQWLSISEMNPSTERLEHHDLVKPMMIQTVPAWSS